jgi:hypothetical protein
VLLAPVAPSETNVPAKGALRLTRRRQNHEEEKPMKKIGLILLLLVWCFVTVSCASSGAPGMIYPDPKEDPENYRQGGQI